MFSNTTVEEKSLQSKIKNDQQLLMFLPDAKRRLIWHGIFVFLLSLLVGAAVPLLRNPRMGLAAHVGGVLSGMLLILVGLIWEEIKLRGYAEKAAYWLFLYA